MAEGAYYSCSINAAGTEATISFDKPGAGTWAAAYTYDSAKAPTFACTSDGYTAATLTTKARTITTQAMLSESVVSDRLVVVVRLAGTFHDDDTSLTVTTTADWVTDGTGDTSGGAVDQAITNSSTLDYPKVIGRWATAPYQRVTSTFVVEAACFDKYGLDSVVFSCSDGTTTITSTATAMTKSAVDGCYLYVGSFTASAFIDGTLTINFKAYPLYGDAASIRDTSAADGTTVPLTFRNNYGSTYDSVYAYVSPTGDDGTGAVNDIAHPFLSALKAVDAIKVYKNGLGHENNAQGGIVYFTAGNHTLRTGTASGLYLCPDEWVIFTHAPEASKETSILSGTHEEMTIEKLKVTGLTVTRATGGGIIKPGGTYSGDCSLWLDDCDCTGAGRWVAASDVIYHVWEGVWLTNDYITASQFAFRTGLYTKLCRNIEIISIGEDAFSNCAVVINCTADDLDPGETGAHSDAWQHFNNLCDENVILYCYRATALNYQGIFWGDRPVPIPACQGVAIVNVFLGFTASPIGGGFCAFGVDVDHLLLWNITMINGDYWLFSRNDLGVETTFTNASVKGNCWYWCQSSYDEKAKKDLGSWDQNHYITGTAFETSNSTTGDAGVDTWGRPEVASTLRNRLIPPPVLGDASNSYRGTSGDAGAYEYTGDKKCLFRIA
jgi:hypothetical protein